MSIACSPWSMNLSVKKRMKMKKPIRLYFIDMIYALIPTLVMKRDTIPIPPAMIMKSMINRLIGNACRSVFHNLFFWMR